MKKRRHKNNLISNTIYSFLIKGVGATASMIFSVLMSRMIGASGVGQFTLAISVVTLVLILTQIGLQNAIIKTIAVYENFGNTIKKVMVSSFKITGILSIATTMIIFLSSGVISKYIFHKPNLAPILSIVILAVFANTINSIFCAAMKGISKPKFSMFFESGAIPTFQILFIAISYFIFHNLSVHSVSWGYVISAFIVMSITLCVWTSQQKQLGSKEAPNFNYKNDVLKLALPLMIVTATNYILTSTDILILGLWSNEAEIGIYNIATKVTTISSMLLIAVNSVLGPQCAKMWKNENKVKLESIIVKYTKFMIFIAIIFFIVFYAFDDFILSIFGQEFIRGITVLHITLWGQLFVLGTGPVATILMMTGHEKAHRNNTMFFALTNLVLDIILIPNYGIEGAALATTFCLIFKNCFAVFLVYRKTGIRILTK